MKGLVLLAVIAGSTTSHAQTDDQVLKAMAAISAQEVQINTVTSNLSDMLSTLHNGDNAGAEIAAEEGNYLIAKLSAVDSLGPLIGVMQIKADRSQLVAMLHGDAAGTIQAAEVCIKTINKALGLMKSPAAVTEVTKLRDAIIPMRGLLRQLIKSDE
jgi:hypothetical protein